MSYQSKWDEAVCKVEFQKLKDNATTDIDRARLLAAKASGEWLKAMPCDCLGTHMDNETVRLALLFRLGGQVVAPHKCHLWQTG